MAFGQLPCGAAPVRGGKGASFSGRVLAVRDRLLASPRFQRWAAAFPLTRPVARRRARQLFDLCAGFVYSQVLLACVRLGLFEILAEAPQTIEALKARLALSDEAARRLLDAAVALRLVSRRGEGQFALGPLGAPLVGNGAIRAMVEHHALLYADLQDPVALLRGESKEARLPGYWAYAAATNPADLPEDRVAAYSALMTASQPLVANEILDAVPLHRYQCLLDVGGGEGAFLIAAMRRAPRLRAVLFDLPPVAMRAQARITANKLAHRALVVSGDFLVDSLPPGADILSLIRVIHDHDDEGALVILRGAWRALSGNGTLLLAEPMAATPGAERVGDAYFGFYLFAMGRGRPRSARELARLLTVAGFDSIRPVATRLPLQVSLLLARSKNSV